MIRIEVFSASKDALGEGPLWDVNEQRLYWIDSYGPAIHRADASGGDRKRCRVPEPIGSLALREKGGAVLALRSGFHFFDFGSGRTDRINETQPGELRPGSTTARSIRADGSLPGRWTMKSERASVSSSGSIPT